MINKAITLALVTLLAGTTCVAQDPTRPGIRPLPPIRPTPAVIRPEPDILIDPIWEPPILPPPPICPEIVSTTSICRRCRQPECITTSTVTVPTFCQNPPLARYTAHKCHKSCPTGCASTEYVYVTPTAPPIFTPTRPPFIGFPPLVGLLPFDWPPLTLLPPLPEPTEVGTDCAVTVTTTIHPGTADGCDYDCSSEFWCIADAAVELPCGCTRATRLVTETETACATNSDCFECQTGWGIATITEECTATPTLRL
ncbi:hypothetical protein HJFPF1_09708 [Paramyrothecium foliicola]|nr:hypothetical protein HJFPF1_09708 [Paramyrothecium foliicola]